MEYERLSAGCYKSKDGRIEINKLPDGAWAWAVDGVGYDAAQTLRDAKGYAEEVHTPPTRMPFEFFIQKTSE